VKSCSNCALMESVPPRLYGGTERVVSYLTEDWSNSATMLRCSQWRFHNVGAASELRRLALRLDPHVVDPIPYYMLMLDRVRQQAATFDILHFTSTTCTFRYFVA